MIKNLLRSTIFRNSGCWSYMIQLEVFDICCRATMSFLFHLHLLLSTVAINLQYTFGTVCTHTFELATGDQQFFSDRGLVCLIRINSTLIPVIIICVDFYQFWIARGFYHSLENIPQFITIQCSFFFYRASSSKPNSSMLSSPSTIR